MAINIPKNEHLCVTYTNAKGKQYICTANQMNDTYYLYEVGDKDKLTKVKKSNCPIDFDEIVFGKE